jgi:hypothetical protein
MHQLQLASFALALAALVVCGRIFTRKPRKKLPTETLRPAVPDEHQPGCFAFEEETGGNWKGSAGTVPFVKEAKPSLLPEGLISPAMKRGGLRPTSPSCRSY